MADAHVRVVHCSPDTPSLDVSIGGTARQVAYGEVTSYVTVPTGTADVTATPADGGEQAQTARATPRVRTNSSQTVLVLGLGDESPLQMITLEDDSASVRAQYARLRFVNAVPGSPGLDLRFADPVVDGNRVLSRQIEFGENGTYRTIDAGSRRFDVGIDSRHDGYRQVLTAERSFEGGQAYTAVALGRADEGYDLLLLEDTPVKTPSA